MKQINPPEIALYFFEHEPKVAIVNHANRTNFIIAVLLINIQTERVVTMRCGIQLTGTDVRRVRPQSSENIVVTPKCFHRPPPLLRRSSP